MKIYHIPAVIITLALAIQLTYVVTSIFDAHYTITAIGKNILGITW